MRRYVVHPRKYAVYLTIFVVILVYMSPVVWLFSQSIKTERDIFSFVPVWIPSNPTLQNYVDVFGYFQFAIPLAHSVLVAGCTTLLTLAVAVPSAYALSRYKFPGVRTLLLAIVVARMIVPPALLTPLYEMLKLFGLINTPVAIIIAHLTLTFPLAVWLIKAFFDELPVEIEEAAMVDGTSTLEIITKVVLPLSAPSLAVVSILSFVDSWNEYMFASLFASSYRVGSTAIAGMLSTYKIWWGSISAGGLIFSLPMIAIALFAQKYIVSGILAGAVKA
jgi:multiple sugar transport system permease protein